MTYGQPHVGTDSGPKLLRQGGLSHMLADLGWRVDDVGNLNLEGSSTESTTTTTPSFEGKAKNHRQVGQGAYQVAQAVEQALREGRFPLVLGGDHSIGMGTLSGLLQVHKDAGVIWVDAHADINTPLISESGNMHGMPIGLLLDGLYDNHAQVPGLEWMVDAPRLPPSNLVYIGLRDVDPAERTILRDYNIRAYTMHEIDRYGIGPVLQEATDYLLKDHPQRPLHLSYDIDAVDPLLAPATGTTVRGGLTYREAHYVAEAVAYTGNLVSGEIVEVNPSLSEGSGAQETVDLGLQLITSFMGKSII